MNWVGKSQCLGESGASHEFMALISLTTLLVNVAQAQLTFTQPEHRFRAV